MVRGRKKDIEVVHDYYLSKEILVHCTVTIVPHKTGLSKFAVQLSNLVYAPIRYVCTIALNRRNSVKELSINPNFKRFLQGLFC